MSVEILRPDIEDNIFEEEPEEMASLEHGDIISLLISYLVQYVYPKKLGRIFEGQTSFKVGGTPPRRQPDIAFVAQDRLPVSLRVKAEFAPDLAVEVVSETDNDFEIEAKVIQYQTAGVRLIWVIHPISQTVEVFRLSEGLRSQRLLKEDELDGYEVIPGFKLAVSNLFV